MTGPFGLGRRLGAYEPKRIAWMLLACYGGALVGHVVPHLAMGGGLSLGSDKNGLEIAIDLVFLALGPVAVVGMAIVTPGPNIALAATVMLAALLRRSDRFIARIAVLALGFAAVASWTFAAWRTR